MSSGLSSFAFHIADSSSPTFLDESVMNEIQAPLPTSEQNSEVAAQQYLQSALRATEFNNFNLEDIEVNGEEPEFKSLGVNKIPFTGTSTVKFRQYHCKVPVYGSLVTVELSSNNNLVSISSSLGNLTDVNPVASISPAQALQKVRSLAGYKEDESLKLKSVPRLYYYYDQAVLSWRLVYIIEDIFDISSPDSQATEDTALPKMFDYVIDAHNEQLVAKLPRIQDIDKPFTEKIDTFTEEIDDDGGKKYKIVGSLKDGNKYLIDSDLNINTHDFGFLCIEEEEKQLPGDCVKNPPTWDLNAIYAHAHTANFIKFFKDILKRNGLDNKGGKIVSSINCCVKDKNSNEKEWDGAGYFAKQKQTIYGQIYVDTKLISYAIAEDVVAHELMHGVTAETAKLEYQYESGALNESYSDIFGIIVANFKERDIDKWNWKLGSDLPDHPEGVRDLSDPDKDDQPDHMKDYKKMNFDSDYGGVHVNSGIHNKAAYNILTAKDSEGKYLFDAEFVAKLFYLALSERLSRTSTFADSRQGVELWAKSLLEVEVDDPNKEVKLQAIAKAFDDVGIRM